MVYNDCLLSTNTIMNKIKQKTITAAEYNKKMAAIIKKDLSVEDKLIALLDEAAKYNLKKDIK